MTRRTPIAPLLLLVASCSRSPPAAAPPTATAPPIVAERPTATIQTPPPAAETVSGPCGPQGSGSSRLEATTPVETRCALPALFLTDVRLDDLPATFTSSCGGAVAPMLAGARPDTLQQCRDIAFHAYVVLTAHGMPLSHEFWSEVFEAASWYRGTDDPWCMSEIAIENVAVLQERLDDCLGAHTPTPIDDALLRSWLEAMADERFDDASALMLFPFVMVGDVPKRCENVASPAAWSKCAKAVGWDWHRFVQDLGRPHVTVSSNSSPTWMSQERVAGGAWFRDLSVNIDPTPVQCRHFGPTGCERSDETVATVVNVSEQSIAAVGYFPHGMPLQ